MSTVSADLDTMWVGSYKEYDEWTPEYKHLLIRIKGLENIKAQTKPELFKKYVDKTDKYLKWVNKIRTKMDKMFKKD